MIDNALYVEDGLITENCAHGVIDWSLYQPLVFNKKCRGCHLTQPDCWFILSDEECYTCIVKRLKEKYPHYFQKGE